MELANPSEKGRANGIVRAATKADADAIFWLMKTAPHTHVHVDWHLPIDWLGSPGFVVMVTPPSSSRTFDSNANKLYSPRPTPLRACLAAAADPPPAAWIRVLSIAASEKPLTALEGMLAHVASQLKSREVSEVGWLAASERWPAMWMKELGFRLVNQIETYVKADLSLPDLTDVPELTFRQATPADMVTLAALETAAFEPLWRHSAEGLSLARYQAISFDVALFNDELVGFQLSTRGDESAHLVRLTVTPKMQGMGVGSALLKRAIMDYRRAGLKQVSLNTQIDNYASQYLYRKFGFQASGERVPVWSLPL